MSSQYNEKCTTDWGSPAKYDDQGACCSGLNQSDCLQTGYICGWFKNRNQGTNASCYYCHGLGGNSTQNCSTAKANIDTSLATCDSSIPQNCPNELTCDKTTTTAPACPPDSGSNCSFQAASGICNATACSSAGSNSLLSECISLVRSWCCKNCTSDPACLEVVVLCASQLGLRLYARLNIQNYTHRHNL